MKYPLHTISNHFFLEKDGGLWLIDTGAPQSFGGIPTLELGGIAFEIPDNYMGLTSAQLSEFVSADCIGLLGADVWGSFDALLDQSGESIMLSTEELELDGVALGLEDFMGIPVVTANIAGANHRMFFDTGAQISYLQDDSIVNHPKTGSMEDFYPGFGSFSTDIHQVPIKLEVLEQTLSFGKLPELLAGTLSLADTTGIIGNELLMGRTVGYFPRRQKLILSE